MIVELRRPEEPSNGTPYPYTVKALVSGHPRELEKVSVSGAVRLRELFP